MFNEHTNLAALIAHPSEIEYKQMLFSHEYVFDKRILKTATKGVIANCEYVAVAVGTGWQAIFKVKSWDFATGESNFIARFSSCSDAIQTLKDDYRGNPKFDNFIGGDYLSILKEAEVKHMESFQEEGVKPISMTNALKHLEAYYGVPEEQIEISLHSHHFMKR